MVIPYLIPLIEISPTLMHTYIVNFPCMHTHIDIHNRGLFQLPPFPHPFSISFPILLFELLIITMNNHFWMCLM